MKFCFLCSYRSRPKFLNSQQDLKVEVVVPVLKWSFVAISFKFFNRYINTIEAKLMIVTLWSITPTRSRRSCSTRVLKINKHVWELQTKAWMQWIPSKLRGVIFYRSTWFDLLQEHEKLHGSVSYIKSFHPNTKVYCIRAAQHRYVLYLFFLGRPISSTP